MNLCVKLCECGIVQVAAATGRQVQISVAALEALSGLHFPACLL